MTPTRMTIFRRNLKIESAPLDAESILFNPDTKQFVKLNQTSAAIWNRLADGATVDEIADTLCQMFDGVLPDQAKQDANKTLDEMLRLGLVSPS